MKVRDFMRRIEKEIQDFLNWPQLLIQRGFSLQNIDPHGFVLSESEIHPKDQIDLLVTGLTHGDEVVGIEVINKLLGHLKPSDLHQKKIGFMLCNIEAALKEVRCVESDLNRSFGLLEAGQIPETLEQKRAAQISPIIQRSKFTLDLHQTIEASLFPFFVMVHLHDVIETAHELLPQYPIVTFDAKGFSKSGKTMMEYALMVNQKAMVIECGQKGFSEELSNEIEKACLRLIKNLSQKKTLQNKDIEVLHIEGSILSDNETLLFPGFLSLSPFKRGQDLAFNDQGNIKADFEGYLIFPSYEEKTMESYEICNLCRKINYLEKD